MPATRREFLAGMGAAALPARSAPADAVALAKCGGYSAELLPALERMFDQLGGLGRLVKGKTVAVKLNLTGSPDYRLAHTPAGLAHWTHPAVIGATVHLLGKAGARRIRLLESPWNTADPLEEYMIDAGWEPRDFVSAAPVVEFENTNYLGRGKRYSRMKVPGRPYMYPAFDLNHSYEDCDVFATIAKLKEHATAGITLAMKNSFGIAPCTIYGDGCGEDEPSPVPRGGRGIFHTGHRQPSRSAPGEIAPGKSKDDHYRVPRIVTDLVAARPIHLAVIDGIATMTAGEGPWIPGGRAVRPGILVAGTNPVTTDAVSAAAMGFDPMADRGTAPFEQCDSTLRLAEEVGIGTRDLKRIEVRGAAIRDVRFDFRKHRA
jgi:uncharacterized protein (DUF362 family)